MKVLSVVGVTILFVLVGVLRMPVSNAETELENKMRLAGEAAKQREAQQRRDDKKEMRYNLDKNTSIEAKYENGVPTVNVRKTTK